MDFSSDASIKALSDSPKKLEDDSVVESESSFFAATEVLGNSSGGSLQKKEIARSTAVKDGTVLEESEVVHLELQEKKDELLARRNALLQEVQSYRRQIEHNEKQAALKVQSAESLATDTMIDMFWSTLSNNNIFASSRLEFQDEDVGVERIDGRTSLQQELSTKYDTLPLLNMDLRLKYISDYTYQGIGMVLKDWHRGTGNEIFVAIETTFCRSNEPFTFAIKLNYDTKESKLLNWTIRCTNPEMLPYVQPIINVFEGNLPNLLLASYDYDTLKAKRLSIFEEIKSKLRTKVDKCHVDGHSMIIERSFMGSGRTIHLHLRIHFELVLSQKQAWPFHESHIWSKLLRDGYEVKKVNIAAITSSLIQEFGVEKGLSTLCDVCLFPELYKDKS